MLLSERVAGLGVCLVLGCASVPSTPCTQLGRFPGPEDFDLVELDGRRVVIVSAAARREGQSQGKTGFWQIDWATKAVDVVEVRGRDDCSLAPHGVATAEVEPGRWELWSVVHHEPPCVDDHHSIERYRVATDGLQFVERLVGPELTNPNDLDALPDGRLWLSNNPAWPGGKGLVGDMLFHRAKGQILRWDPQLRQFAVAADHLVFPNGVAVVGDRLWVVSAYGKVYRFALDDDGIAREGEREMWRVEPGATLDNIVVDDGALWFTGHPKGLAFIKHRKNPDVPSPTIAYRMSLDDGSSEAVARWRAGEANAGSTVWPLDGQLVVGQVFDDGLRVCQLPE